MNNYLLQLLKEVKTLIIPGLGALTVTNESTGEILFMPYLKFDDGTLAKHIASKENMALNDASNLISKFVREVTIELDKGNSYDMYQFGRFVKVDGEIAFEAWATNSGGQENSSAEGSKTETTSSHQEEELKETAVVQEPVAEKPKEEEPEVVETPKKEEEPKIPETPKVEKVIPPVVEAAKPVIETLEPKKEEPKIEKIVPPVVEEPKVVEKKIEPTAPVEKQVSPKVTAPKKETPIKEPKTPKEKKKTSVFAYILWGFLVLILGSGTFIAIKFDSLKKDFPILADLAGENDDVAKGSEDVKQLEDEPDVNIDSETKSEPIPEDQVQIIEDQLPEEKVVEEPKKETPTPKKETPAPKPTPKPKPAVKVNKKPVTKTPKATSSATFDGSKPFHIIAGSFGSETNANRLASKLQSKGFGEASVTMNGGMYRVSVKGFSTLNEATAEAASMQSSIPGAWVMKM
ncbi:SPOR domain-containing protein [Fluviicola taffensis]|uniref:SPOR domain-containing protein n=1 Tax=Fluviicola taffensis TaxID=191579 RepID=UPI0031379473